jgi:YidC/Oxa1 family membrane protein insertase
MDKRTILYIILLSVTFFFMQRWFFPEKAKVSKPSNAQATLPVEKKALSSHGEENFYTLENEYAQLVFSSQGGALSEINLPLHSKEHPQSVIHEIDFDREIVANSPTNAHFPLHSDHLGGYYPLIRRPVVTLEGTPSHPVPYALSIIDDASPTTIPTFSLQKQEKNLLQFVGHSSNRKITKTFSFSEKTPYFFDLIVKVEGDAKNLWLSSGIPEVELTSGSFAPILKFHVTSGQKSSVEKIDLPKESITVLSTKPDWVCNSNGFLGLILDPLDAPASGYRVSKVDGALVPTRLTLIDKEHYPAADYPGYQIFLSLKEGENHFRIFAGPFQDEILKNADKDYSDPKTGYSPDYVGAESYHGWFAFLSEPFAKFLFLLMKLFYKFTHSWGFSIILLTIALRIMLYPLNSWSIKSNAKMQELAPKIKSIQAKFKKDPKRMQMETMKAYREMGVNPFMGCLPILIQMPFLIGMFDLLKSTFELRGASFIPGWINNLTAPDVLFSWNFRIFFIGNQFHLLPILLGVIMFVQQRMSAKLPKNRSEWTDQQRQLYVMAWMLPVFFTFMFYQLPSGLNIYWFSSMVLGIVQQWWMTRKTKGIEPCKPGKCS